MSPQLSTVPLQTVFIERPFLRFLKDFSPSVNVLESVFVLLTTASMMNMIFFNELRGWQP